MAKLIHKNRRPFYKKTFLSTMTLKEGDREIRFFSKGESTADDRNYSDEGSPFKNTKGGEIKSIYLRFLSDAYGAMKVKPSSEALIDGYAKIVNSGMFFMNHDTDKIEEMPLCELLPPSPILFLPEYKNLKGIIAPATEPEKTFEGYIQPIQVIQPASQSVHMKGSNQLLIAYDKPLYAGPNATFETFIKFLGGVSVPSALVGYKLSLGFVSKVFTEELQVKAA
jgi:hypothetical protein